MSAATLVFAELDGGKVRDSAWEAIALAKKLGGPVATAVLGKDIAAAAADLAGRGGGTVHALSHDLLENYTPDGYCQALKELAGETSADLWLFPHSPMGWDLAPKLSALLDGACGTEVFRVEKEDGDLLFAKKALKGKFDLIFRLEGTPRIVTLQAGACEAYEGSDGGEVVERTPALEAGAIRDRFVEIRKVTKGEDSVDLTQSKVIVAGGRGVGGEDKFGILEELARLLGGDIGASRPVTDAGWLPGPRQIGSSGVRVKPKLYVALGISGAIQHTVGMKDSGFKIAVNKDANAPIFEVCDVGVVGDIFEYIPALVKALKEARGEE